MMLECKTDEEQATCRKPNQNTVKHKAADDRVPVTQSLDSSCISKTCNITMEENLTELFMEALNE